MSPLRSRLLACALLVAPFSPAAIATVNVKLATPAGDMTFELYDDVKPVTVTNFLRYIRDGRFTDSFAHRLPVGFVLQGGGFTVNSSGGIFTVPTYGTIVNEAGPFPAYSNLQGTIAMAKLPATDGNGNPIPGGGPDSASSGWFLNLGDNSANLDTQNGGFTVFGKVTTGMSVVQRFAAFQTYVKGSGIAATDLIYNLDNGGTFAELPVMSYTGSGGILLSNLVTTTWTILDGPTPVITSPSIATGKAGKSFTYQITSTNSPTGFSVSSGTLPDGLSLDATTGVISGPPSATGTTDVTIAASGTGGTGSAALSIIISAAPAPTPTPAPAPTVTAKPKATGSNGRVTLKGSAANAVKVDVKAGKKAFKATKGTPAKWTFTASGLKPGKYKFQVRATNADGQATIRNVTVLMKD